LLLKKLTIPQLSYQNLKEKDATEIIALGLVLCKFNHCVEQDYYLRSSRALART
jgi:hypothetical protein